MHKLGRRRWRAYGSSQGGRASFCVVATVGAAVLLSGCTRNFFRKRADEEVDSVLVEKDKYPNWRIDQFHIYPDPRARFADLTNPDRPPMPPDDPASYDLSPNPQRPGKAGVAAVKGDGYLQMLSYWDEQNRAEAAERAKEAAK